jgi:hypothetical protein
VANPEHPPGATSSLKPASGPAENRHMRRMKALAAGVNFVLICVA